ncbi:hypothetical protein EAI_09092 [Harpegnathos saltator]|uniref:Uncharacterized protein n=1 Tax=Harpegnathos saltator TaxID=610380 RepID=E2BSA2_HARSA|nr:hypothetical protein EAI_09092 [Harpegnathos saltator]
MVVDWNVWYQTGIVCFFVLLGGLTALLIYLWRSKPGDRLAAYMTRYIDACHAIRSLRRISPSNEESERNNAINYKSNASDNEDSTDDKEPAHDSSLVIVDRTTDSIDAEDEDQTNN